MGLPESKGGSRIIPIRAGVEVLYETSNPWGNPGRGSTPKITQSRSTNIHLSESSGHLPRWPRSLLTEQTRGLWEQEIHWQGVFLMTVSRPEPDFPPCDMRWPTLGRPSTHPHVGSAQEIRQGAMPGFVSYSTTTREIKMIARNRRLSFMPTFFYWKDISLGLWWYFFQAHHVGNH